MYSEELSDRYLESIEEMSGNLEEVIEILEDDQLRHGNERDRGLEATAIILDYATREYDLDPGRSWLSRQKILEGLGGDESKKVERYPESVLNHMEMVLYSFEDLLEGGDELRRYPSKFDCSPVERHDNLAELSGEILSKVSSST